MTYEEIYQQVKEASKEYNHIENLGLRFANREMEEGDKCKWSKHNPARNDARDFPEFDSEEYEDLPSMGGTSAYAIRDIVDRQSFNRVCKGEYQDWDDEVSYEAKYIYIIGGRYTADEFIPDRYEIVIEDAEILATIK